LESIERDESVSGDKKKKTPKRLYFRSVSGGRVRLSSSEDIGGSWMCYLNLIREVIDGKRSEAWFQFVENTPEYEMKRKNR
jgi:hypothetical protein